MTHNRLSRLRRRVFCFGCLLQLIAGQGDGSKGRGGQLFVPFQVFIGNICLGLGVFFRIRFWAGGHGQGYHLYFLEKRTYMNAHPGGRVYREQVALPPLKFFSIFNLDV